MDALVWVKEYKVSTSIGDFKLFVAEHKGVGFYSSVLYLHKDANGSELKLEKRFDLTEAGAFAAIKQWVDSSFPSALITLSK